MIFTVATLAACSPRAPNDVATPQATPSPSPGPATPTPSGVTVTEAIALRDGGDLGSDPFTLEGYWSNRIIGHSCAAGPPNIGELELYCHGDEYGITERNEPVLEWERPARLILTDGPRLVPWMPDEIGNRLFTLPMIGDAFFPPVPIVVLAHFDDPRAADCREEARQACRERLVLDELLSFDPSSVPPPTPAPPPTPFPSPGPAALFGTDRCVVDVDYSFIGWTTTDELKLALHHEGHVFAMVTKDPMPFGGWTDDTKGSGQKVRSWGQMVCYSEDWYIGDTFNEVPVAFGVVLGTEFREFEDGRREPMSSPY